MSCRFAIVINGTACLIIHTELVFTAIVAPIPYFFQVFFLLLRNFVYTQPGDVVNDSAHAGAGPSLVVR